MKRLKTQILLTILALAIGLSTFSLPVANAPNESREHVILWEGDVVVSEIIDEQQTTYESWRYGDIFDVWWGAQQFSVDFIRQTKVELLMAKLGNPPNSLTVDIRTDENDEPSDTIIVSTSLPPSAFVSDPNREWETFNLPDWDAIIGAKYWVVARTTGGDIDNYYEWFFKSSGNPYEKGLLGWGWIDPPIEVWETFETQDFTFKLYAQPQNWLSNVGQIDLRGESEVKIEFILTDIISNGNGEIDGYNRFGNVIAESISLQGSKVETINSFARLSENPNLRVRIDSGTFHLVIRHRKGGGVAGGVVPSAPPPFGWRPFEIALFSGILIAGFVFIVPTLIIFLRFNSRKVLHTRAFEKPKQIVRTVGGKLKWKKED